MYTVEEFALKTGRSLSAVRDWLKKGLIAKKKFSGVLYFNDTDVEQAKELMKDLEIKKRKGMKWTNKK